MTEKIQYIPARLKNASVGGHVAGADDIIDDKLGKEQSQVNQDRISDINEIKGGSTESIASLKTAINNEKSRAEGVEEGLNTRLGVVEQLAEISVGGGDIGIAAASDFDDPSAAQEAKVPTVAAVLGGISNGVFDLTAKTGDSYATLADALTAANTIIPANKKKGGMEMRFVLTSDNTYVQYMYIGTEVTGTPNPFLNTANWEKINLEEEVSQLSQEINGRQEYQPLSVELTTGYYYNQSNNKVSTTLVEREDTSCARIDVTAGDKFKIYGRGTAVVHLYAFTDSNRNVLLTNTEIVNTRENGLELTAPEGSAYLYINYYLYDSSTDKLEKYISTTGLKQRVEDLEEGKVAKTDIVDNLNTDDATKPLSAKQGKVLDAAIQTLNTEINGTHSYIPVTLSLTSDNYYGINTTSNTVNSSTTSRNGTNCANLDVTAGDKFKVYGKGGPLICLYIFADASCNILSRNTENVNSRDGGLEITAPTNSAKLYINFLDYSSSTDKLEKDTYTANGISQRLDALEISSKGVLKDKVFIAFGDSITEFKWPVGSGGDNKGWVEHTEELTGCTIINCAIGGSHMNGRYNTELFDASHEYAVGDYVFYKPSDTMNLYKCINAHSGAWDANDFEDVSENQSLIGTVAYSPIFVYPMIHAFCNTAVVDKNERFKNQIAAAECVYTWKTSHDDNRAIIERLKNADVSQIEGVIIAEGTNDYASAWNRGTSGSFDVSTCLGATNQAILELCSTYKNFALYYVTPPVRWWNWSNGSGNIADFSDNYKDGGDSDITLREWVSTLINEYQLRHIPVCDLYNELGWNQWNFANYFPASDGTHPRPGFKNIGAKVASFLISHNVIK